MDSKLHLIGHVSKHVAEHSHLFGTLIDDKMNKKLNDFKNGIKSNDPHKFVANYTIKGSKVFGSKINIGKPKDLMRKIFQSPTAGLLAKVITPKEKHEWNKEKQLHYSMFEKGPVPAFIVLVKEMYEEKKNFLDKLHLTESENRTYDSIFNSRYLSLISELIKKTKSKTQDGIIYEITTKGFDPRSDFICEMLYRKFKEHSKSYSNLIRSIKTVNTLVSPIHTISSTVKSDVDKLTK
jgi:hypothetical protein